MKPECKHDWKNTEILITGGAGSLGKTLTKLLLKNYNPKGIRIFSRDEHKHQVMKQELANEGYKGNISYLIGDIRDKRRLKIALSGVDVLINTAAMKQVGACEDNPIEAIKTNISSVENIVEASIYNKVSVIMHISTDKACLDYHTRVETNMGIIPIHKIVNQKIKCHVKSYSHDTKTFVWKPITNWYKNKLQNRKLYKITFKNNSYSSKGTKRRLIVTEDHLISTPDGYKKASNLKNNDYIYTGESIPNDLQKQVLIGTLLGDSALIIPKRSVNDTRRFLGLRPHMILGHAEDQKEWLYLKLNAMKGIKQNKIIKEKRTENKQTFFRCNLSACGYFKEIYSDFYKNKKRILPKLLIKKHFSPLLMATWFMDDGCMSDGLLRLATHAYAKEEVVWLIDFLNKKGFECSYLKLKYKDSIYYETRFSKKGSIDLTKFISEYIPNKLKYKQAYITNDFDVSLWNTGEAESFYDKLEIEETGYKTTRDVYCIDVQDTHNFVANNILVHNCYPVNLYGMTKGTAEKVFIHSNIYSPHTTKFSCCRYGNVLGSRGSIIPVVQEKIKNNQPIEVTDVDMTRFWISLPQVAQFIIDRIMDMRGAEIFVPKMPSTRLMDMLAFLIPETGYPVKNIGIRPGEKIHEVLITHEESMNTKSEDNYFIVKQQKQNIDNKKTWSYTSENNPYRMKKVEFIKMMGDKI